MKRVLIAIDYDASAQRVAETGCTFARLMNAEATMVHAVSGISHYPMAYTSILGFDRFSSDGPFMNIDEQRNEANDLLEDIVYQLGDYKIKTCVLDRKTSDTILQYALQSKSDLIVMGTQNHCGFEKISPGNVTSIILRKSAIPVLVIPPGRSKREIMVTNEYEYTPV